MLSASNCMKKARHARRGRSSAEKRLIISFVIRRPFAAVPRSRSRARASCVTSPSGPSRAVNTGLGPSHGRSTEALSRLVEEPAPAGSPPGFRLASHDEGAASAAEPRVHEDEGRTSPLRADSTDDKRYNMEAEDTRDGFEGVSRGGGGGALLIDRTISPSVSRRDVTAEAPVADSIVPSCSTDAPPSLALGPRRHHYGPSAATHPPPAACAAAAMAPITTAHHHRNARRAVGAEESKPRRAADDRPRALANHRHAMEGTEQRVDGHATPTAQAGRV